MNAPIPTDWYRNFFKGVALDMWRNATPPELTRSETDFVEKALKITQASRMLDVPCGNGRLAVELAGRGHTLAGVDISDENIAEAQAEAAKRNFKIEWKQGDMRSLPWDKAFDAVFCCGNSFGYLDDLGNRAFIQAASRTLKPGGRFLIDYGCVAEAILPNFQEKRWYLVGDIHLLIHNRHNIALSRLETEYTFVRNGQVETRYGLQRIYTYRELTAMMESAGLNSFEAYQGMDMQPFRLGSQRLYLTAVRQ